MTLSSGSRIKGAVLIARLDFIRNRGGEQGLKQVLARLPEADRQVLGGMLVRVGWYPLDLHLRLDGAIADALSPGNPSEIFLEMGRASAETNLNGPQAPFVKKGDPHYLLRNAPQVYSAYHDTGRRTYEQAGERAAILRTFDAEIVDARDCLTTLGWIERAVEISGARAPKATETRCRARGDLHCEVHVAWS
jgi:uncharacterized protein (TIGR02265 family)